MATIVEGGPTGPVGDLRSVIVEDSGESEAEELLCLYRATHFLAAYGRHAEARSVITAHRAERKKQGGAPSDSTYALLQASVSIGADKQVKRFPQDLKQAQPDAGRFYWARNIALTHAWQANLHSAGTKTRPTSPPSLFERGDCLSILGTHFYFRGHLARALSYLEAAAQAPSGSPSAAG